MSFRNLLAAGLVLALLTVAAPAAHAEGGTFIEVLSSSVGADAIDAAVGDFNGDGNPDLAVANRGDGDISVFEGDGRGRFGAQPDLSSTGPLPSALVSADFDGDGDDDLAVANEGGGVMDEDEIAVFDGSSSGLSLDARYPGAGFTDGPTALVVADLEGDAELDIGAATPLNTFVQVLVGDGTGAFTGGSLVVNMPASLLSAGTLTAGDPDGDNDADLITAGTAAGSPVFTTSLWNGTMFDPAVSNPTGMAATTAVASGPFDAGVAHEVVAGTTDAAAAPTDGVAEFFDDGTPPLASASTVDVGEGAPTDIEVSEFDGDGFLDVAVAADDDPAGGDDSTLSILLNDGAGTFTHAAGSPLATVDPVSVKEADLTGDGTVDLVEVRGAPTNAVRVLLGDLDTDLSAALSAPSSVSVGEPLTYTITAANLGASDPANAAVATLQMPPGSTFSSGSPGCAPAGTTVVCALGSIPALAQQQATVTVIPSVPGSVTASATVDSDAYDPQEANDSDSTGTTVSALPEVPEPETSERVVVEATEGTIRIKRPGQPFETLQEDEEIPLGSIIDATQGRVEIISEGRDGELRTAVFYGSKFRITQVTQGKFTVAEIVGPPGGCGKNKAPLTTARKKKKGKSLFANGGSGHRTVGRNGAATVRGTIWRTTDSCEGTRFNAIRDSITVRDFQTKKKIVLEEGEAYLAKAGN